MIAPALTADETLLSEVAELSRRAQALLEAQPRGPRRAIMAALCDNLERAHSAASRLQVLPAEV